MIPETLAKWLAGRAPAGRAALYLYFCAVMFLGMLAAWAVWLGFNFAFSLLSGLPFLDWLTLAGLIVITALAAGFILYAALNWPGRRS